MPRKGTETRDRRGACEGGGGDGRAPRRERPGRATIQPGSALKGIGMEGGSGSQEHRHPSRLIAPRHRREGYGAA